MQSRATPDPGNPPKLPPFTSSARSVLTIGLAIFSLLLAITPWLLSSEPTLFFVGNRVPLLPRLISLGLSAGGGILFIAAVLWRTHRLPDPQAAQQSIASVVAPLMVSAFVPMLFASEAWQGRDFAFLSCVLAVGLGFERLLRPACEVIVPWLSRVRDARPTFTPIFGAIGRWLPPALTALLIIGYIVTIGNLTNISHMKLATMSSDLAEYDNLFFNALHGHPFRAPAIAGLLEDWNNLQGHAEFCLYFLLPFYAIAPGASTLLWIQTCAVALTAIPIFLLGRSRLGGMGGLCFVVAFLMAPALQQPNFYDFHFTCLGMLFVAFLLYFAATLADNPKSRGRRIGLYTSMALAFLTREDMSIGIAVLGTFLVLSGVLLKDGLILAGLSVAYLVTMKFAVMPLFGHWWFDAMYEDLKAEGAKGFGAIILTLISNPSFVLRSMLIEPKFLYLLHMTVPFLALWLRRPLLWLAFLPGFVSTLMVSNRPPLYQASFQYTYIWLPYVVAASVMATKRGLKGAGSLGALLLAAAPLTHHFGVFPSGEKIMGGFSLKTFEFGEAEQLRYDQLQEIIGLMPPDAVVAVTETEGPHLSTRLIMYSLKYTLGPFPEYLLIHNVRIGGEVAHLRQALESERYGVIAQRGPFVLAQLGADPSKNGVLWRKVGGKSRIKR